jgi:hypothetical protein
MNLHVERISLEFDLDFGLVVRKTCYLTNNVSRPSGAQAVPLRSQVNLALLTMKRVNECPNVTIRYTNYLLHFMHAS